MVQHHQVGQTTNRQPDPSLLGVARKSTQQARGQHDEVRRDSSEQVPARQTGDEREIDEE